MNNVDLENGKNSFFYQNTDFNRYCGIINYEPCELCKVANVNGPDVNRNVSRLLRVNATLRNCCIGRELSVACIIFDQCNNILAYKTKTFIVKKHDCGTPGNGCSENENLCCCTGACTDVDKLFTFVLPVHDVCSPLTVRAKIVANYTSVSCNM